MTALPVINPAALATFVADPSAGLDIARPARDAIERLIHTYSYNWDSRDANATAALFVDTAEVSFFLDGNTEPIDHTVGRDPLRQAMVKRTDLLKRWRVETRHLMLSTVFGPTENDEVQAMTTAVIFWQQLPDHPAPIPVQTGYYRSWCAETDQGWRFRRRETHMSGVFHPKHLFQRPD